MTETTNETQTTNGQPSRRGRKPGQAPKVRPALDLGSLEVTKITERRTMAEFRRTRGERPAEQKAIDQIVDRAYQAWVEAGKPTNWVQQPGMLLRVPASQFETLQFRVRKAGVFYDLRIRFGDIKTTGSGKSKITECVFVATDRPEDEKPDEMADDDEDDNGEESEENGEGTEEGNAEPGNETAE